MVSPALGDVGESGRKCLGVSGGWRADGDGDIELVSRGLLKAFEGCCLWKRHGMVEFDDDSDDAISAWRSDESALFDVVSGCRLAMVMDVSR